MLIEDWSRAAGAVERRMSELRLNRAELARNGKLDRKTVDNFLDRAMKPRTSSRGGYEEALGWAFGSLTTIARGGEPTVAPEQPAGGGEPVGAGVDPALLARMTDLDPEEVRRVEAYIDGIIDGRSS